MDEEVERMLISVRADTAGFARDVADMRGQLEGPLAGAAEQAGRVLETVLARAIRTGKLGFEELKQAALSVMAQIANAAIRAGLNAAGAGGGGTGASIAAALGALLGAPGRATGGPVAPGRAYLVGERGPELFVPTASGRVETGLPGAGREIRMHISINAPPGTEPQALRQSSRQLARAVRQALARVEE